MNCCSGGIVAGGESQRMGSDKRLLSLDGDAMIWRVAAVVAAIVDDIMLACRVRDDVAQEANHRGLRVVIDQVPNAGPLAGVEALLTAARHPQVAIVGADMPFVAPRLLAYLLERTVASGNATVPIVNGRPEPLLAAYPSSSAAIAGAMLASGERRMHAFVERIGYTAVAPADWRQFDPSGRSFVNLNEPADAVAAGVVFPFPGHAA